MGKNAVRDQPLCAPFVDLSRKQTVGISPMLHLRKACSALSRNAKHPVLGIQLTYVAMAGG